jgi:PAS domain S-box-containing protein
MSATADKLTIRSLRVILHYAGAAAAVGLSLGAWRGISDFFGSVFPPFITFYPAIMAVAVLAGFGPGAAATILSSFSAAYWIMPPVGELAFASSADRLALALFGLMGLFMSAVAGLYRARRAKAAAYDDERILRENQEEKRFLADVLQRSSQAFAVGYPDGHLGLVNTAYEKLTGYSAEELARVDWSAVLTPPEWRAYEQEKLEELLRAGKPVRYEKEYIRKDGTRIPVELFVHLATDELGSPAYYYSFITDISHRKQTETALLQSEERFRLALRNAPVSVAVQDHDLRYVWAYNQRTARPEDIIGKTDSDIFTAEETAYMEPIKRRVLEEDIEINRQLWLDRPEGRIFLDVYWEPIHDGAGKVIGVGSTTVNLTPMKLIEEELRNTADRLEGMNAEFRASRVAALNLMEDTDQARHEAERIAAALRQARDELAEQVEQRTRELREKEVLLKEVHHRVKNNLQVISSLVSLQADGSEDRIVREVLTEVAHRVRSMALVHEKLYQSVNLASIDFAEYARSLLGYLWRSHGDTGARIQLDLDMEPLSLPVDIAVPCGLMLNELAGNTLKHAFDGRAEGTVTVRLHPGSEGRVSLEVRDDGVGLPEGFDWRETKSLGLRLVDMLAGQIEAVVSVTVNDGTSFHIAFTHEQT